MRKLTKWFYLLNKIYKILVQESVDIYFEHLKSRPKRQRGEGMFFNARNTVSSFLKQIYVG